MTFFWYNFEEIALELLLLKLAQRTFYYTPESVNQDKKDQKLILS